MSTEPDAVQRYCAASEANDIPALMTTLSPDAELVSPLSGRMVFRGAADLEILLTGVYGLVRAWHWEQPLGEGRRRVLVGDGKVGPFRLGDAMMVELDEAGLIRRLRPHLRPFLGLIAFAMLLGPKLAGHPGVLLRALRG